MNEQFVTYEIASQLEELGFRLTREESFGRFTMKGELVQMPFLVAERTIVAPLWQQVIDWLREKYDLHIDNGWCISDPFGNSQYGYGISVYNKIKDEFIVRDFNLDYYKAREISILKAIDTIKQV